MKNLEKMFNMQASLDQYIEWWHRLEEEALIERKLMAFQVELAELANETRCFKFWSRKGPSEKAVILEEYVDGLHFLLSVGLECGFEEKVEVRRHNIGKADERQLTEDFFQVMEDILALRSSRKLAAYETLFNNFIMLGSHLGFSDDEIEQAYIEKNGVNRQRQDEGY